MKHRNSNPVQIIPSLPAVSVSRHLPSLLAGVAFALSASLCSAAGETANSGGDSVQESRFGAVAEAPAVKPAAGEPRRSAKFANLANNGGSVKAMASPARGSAADAEAVARSLYMRMARRGGAIRICDN